MRKVLWIALLAMTALPMLSDTASACHRRGRNNCNQGCYTQPAQVYYQPVQSCCGSPEHYAPATQQPAGGQQPGAVPEPPRPTTPPIE
jgi:hypothetical protein